MLKRPGLSRIIEEFDLKALDEQVLEKKAYPEMLFKRDIFLMLSRVNEMEFKLHQNYGVAKRYMPIDVQNFRASLIALYNVLKFMIIEKVEELRNRAEKYDAERLNIRKLNKLETTGEISVGELLVLKNLLLEYMHTLHFTNMLVQEVNPFEEFRRQF